MNKEPLYNRHADEPGEFLIENRDVKLQRPFFERQAGL